MIERVTEFDEFTPPMQKILQDAARTGTGYVVCSANPRLVDGQVSKNPRYLQTRPDLLDPFPRYVAERGMHLAGRYRQASRWLLPWGLCFWDGEIIPLIPRQESARWPSMARSTTRSLPELFMDFICSLTGKSPSTTGAGSEGALTKSPFNALRPILDLNAALVSYILTGLAGFSTAAGYVGPRMRVDHDISLLIPEIWCRLSRQERDPKFLIAEGHLEPLQDFHHAGRKVLASRLGYRITAKFSRTFLGRVFDHPARVFPDELLRPETQDLDAFVDGIQNITEAQQRVARQYFEDGSIEDACPPLQCLLEIMAEGVLKGEDVHHPDIRKLFTLDSLLASDWYQKRLAAKQKSDVLLWQRHVRYLDNYLASHPQLWAENSSELEHRRTLAQAELQSASDPAYLKMLNGTLGLDPSLCC